MNYKAFADLSADISKNLFKLHSENYDLIVGIPRSGMIPAYMIGLYFNVHVTSLDALVDNRRLVSGIIRNTSNELEFASDAKNILLVDDSIASGKSMLSALEEIPDNIKAKVTTCAIYSSLKKRQDVDIYFEYVAMPRVFEWNVFHRSLMERACLAIDGVLCLGPTEEQNNDNEKYIEFILDAKPLHIPSAKVKALVTSRLEKYREQTELWLENHNIQYDELIMLELPSKEEKRRLGIHASHKSNYYIKSKLDFFVESEPSQAAAIMQASGKTVFCTGNNSMYTPSISLALIKSPRTFSKPVKIAIYTKTPNQLKKVIRPFHRLLFR